jgi:hypothetical protein
MAIKQKHVRHLPKNKIAEAYGWVGSIFILTAYALLSLGFITGDAIMYHVFMFIGSSGLAVITYRHRAYQSFIVNIFFTFFAFVALIRILCFA